MGSLVPGWDAELVVPRGVMDDESIDHDPAPEGYFARLKSHRSSAGGSSLSRASAPHPAAAPVQAPTLARSSTQAHKPQQPVLRTGSLFHGGGPHPPAGGPQKYHFTDWTAELSSLGGGKRASQGGHEEDRGHSEGGPHDKHSAAWWRALEVGHLNEQFNAEAEAQTTEHGRVGQAGGSFVPQFTEKHELDYGKEENK